MNLLLVRNFNDPTLTSAVGKISDMIVKSRVYDKVLQELWMNDLVWFRIWAPGLYGEVPYGTDRT